MIAVMLSRHKYPFEYELNPSEINVGTNWITVKLKNIGRDALQNLDVQLHSLDTYNLSVFGTGLFGAGHYVPRLESNEEEDLVFRVNAVGSANVYVTIKTRNAGSRYYFTWESGWTKITVSEEKAEIEHFLVQANPYTAIGETISAEATLKGLRENAGLKLEFWVESPSGIRNSRPQSRSRICPLARKPDTPSSSPPRKQGSTRSTRICTMDGDA